MITVQAVKVAHSKALELRVELERGVTVVVELTEEQALDLVQGLNEACDLLDQPEAP